MFKNVSSQSIGEGVKQKSPLVQLQAEDFQKCGKNNKVCGLFEKVFFEKGLSESSK